MGEAGMLARTYRAAWTINPIWAGLTALVAGLVLFTASFPVHVAFANYQIGALTKQIGFVPALNWSLVLIVIFPAAIFTMLLAVRRFDRTLRTLAVHRMLIEPGSWRPATKEEVAQLSDRIWAAAAPMGALFFVAGLIVAAADFIDVVGTPLLKGILPIAPGKIDFFDELDWSISALFGSISQHALPSITENFIFSAAAYTVLGIEMAAILSFYGFLIGVSAEIYALSERRRPLILIPDPKEEDPRRGFAHFAPFFGGVLVTTLLGYVACYLMRIQNLFMREPGYDRLDRMIFADITNNLTQMFHLPGQVGFSSVFGYFAQNLGDLADAVFETGNLGDIQAYLGAIVILIVMLLVTAALFAVLRVAADESREHLDEELADEGARPKIEHLFELPAATIKSRVDKAQMEIWPLRWPRLNGLLALLTLGIVCFLFYRLALIWIAAQILTLFRVRADT
jgi:hypothetical protein